MEMKQNAECGMRNAELKQNRAGGDSLVGLSFDTVELTPAQIDFLLASIDNFDITELNVGLAGQAASSRRFYRVSHGVGVACESYILMEWSSRDEDWPRFLGIEEHVSQTTDILPKIYAADPVHGLILEEDLGAETLKSYINGVASSYKSFGIDMASSGKSRQNGAVSLSLFEEMYRKVIDTMRLWHELDISGCPFIASRSMDVDTFLWETSYFARHCVTEFFGKENILSYNWESERRQMAECAAGLPRVNMHRDFQSENILIHGGRVRFVDYQGARLGPAHYDAASLLFDPYIEHFGDGAGEGLLDYYFDRAGDCGSTGFYVCAAQRLMQALGAYTNLSLHKGKPHYRKFIPVALNRLSHIFDNHLPDYPAMREVVNGCKSSL